MGCSDEYESGGLWTVGGVGAPGIIFTLRSPFNTECEWNCLSITTTSNSNDSFAMSSSNPSILAFAKGLAPAMGALSGGSEANNGFEGILASISFQAPWNMGDIWLPLGRGAQLYFVSTVANTNNIFYTVAFRRSLVHVIPSPPRQKPQTHTHVQPRRAARTMMEGFAAQQAYPGDNPYQHQDLPEQDTAMARRGVMPLGPTSITHRGVGRNRNGR